MKKFIYILFLTITIILTGCNQVTQIASSLLEFEKLKFSLHNIENVNLSGVNLNGKSKISDFSTSEILKLSASVAQKNLPIKFNLILKVENPNYVEGKKSENLATITDFPFELFLDNSPVLNGNIANDFQVPAESGGSYLPLSISFDLMDIIKNGDYEKFANIALNLSGFQTDKVDLRIIAKPRIKISVMDISPSEPITIIHKKL